METFLSGADTVIAILRTALLSIAVVFAAICVIDWAVRTRKISPFNAIARFCRSTVDPIIAPIEKRVVRAGGSPASAALGARGGGVIGGILLRAVGAGGGSHRRNSSADAARHRPAGSREIDHRQPGGFGGNLPPAGELDV